MNKITLTDVSLRDGSHAIQHQLTEEQIALYAKAADDAGVPIIEVGHGNGLAASSLQVGESKLTDERMIACARENIKNSKLGIHVIPGFATIDRDLDKAIDLGVNVVRVASHCTEADITERHITFVRSKGKIAYGVLMMSHMASKETLLDEALKMQTYGAEAIIIMDSAGAYLPRDVTERIDHLVCNMKIPVGFHAHNNLGMAIANSLAAVNAGARFLDGSARGFGAGAGNAAIEVLVGVLGKENYKTNVDLYKILNAAELAEKQILRVIPYISNVSLVSGLAGVFSGFSKHVMRVAAEYGLDPRDIFFELGKRKVVAGQEDIIVEVARKMSGQQSA